LDAHSDIHLVNDSVKQLAFLSVHSMVLSLAKYLV
jgi:hypothetical protein